MGLNRMINIFKKGWVFAAFLLIQVVYGCSSLKLDENVVFFPSSVSQLENGRCEIPIHAWVFEPEKESLRVNWGTKVIAELMEQFGLTEEQTQSAIFRERIRWFLVDNKRNKQLTIQLQNEHYKLAKTQAGGHSYSSLKGACSGQEKGWIDYSVVTQKNDKRLFTGQVQFIPPQGLSVISDIDDTIKISEVLDKRALIRHTFIEPYEAPKGLPAYYQQLAEKGAYFHYVSASPWQLYPSLKGFLETNYPKGTISLRHFRIKDSSIIDFLKSSKEYKLKTIRNILTRYPQHQFILIGDSGENDPEVYAQIYQAFPNNIKQVLIRKVAGSVITPERLGRLDSVFGDKWQLFEQATDIK